MKRKIPGGKSAPGEFFCFLVGKIFTGTGVFANQMQICFSNQNLLQIIGRALQKLF